ncbi:MAG: hypothetical protein A2408_03420 [Candidatus Yonathbacteria bacterium RIFOXYC1_FULL_52_10]|uniref:Uncharacterized protein n=1 Tax=Candidatus Yonathbacteria bacterium RIFOXYD1_FULL_52_36 TaxID=1802730 RepID=A0A1G2SM72_9BACT|nr:MAG: hypothetical protein A2408_03420 [Candidatus Yonathbacteria bacterium RIFOXYC1_FULL_52_10]OHA85902.1 MAG: hypothetical protein A2591_04280 [Candidatus Yonathbacteria bacterium RIFOXYD1_FULL_52_36]
MDIVNVLIGLLALLLLAMIFFAGLAVRDLFRCGECGSWSTRAVESERIDYAEDVGGILQIDPFCIKVRQQVCNHCGNIMRQDVVEVRRAP